MEATPAVPLRCPVPVQGFQTAAVGEATALLSTAARRGKEPFVRGLLLGPCSLSEMGCQRLNAQVTGLYIPDLDV